MQRLAEAVERERLDVELDVGGLEPRIGLHEDAELARRHRHRSRALQRILQPDLRLAQKRRLPFVQRAGALDAEGGADLEMVLQIGADARPVEDDVDPMSAQKLTRTDAGQLQELRRADRARREDDLAMRDRRAPVQPQVEADRRPASMRMRSACAPVRMRRFLRCRIGPRKARTALKRRPAFCVTSK